MDPNHYDAQYIREKLNGLHDRYIILMTGIAFAALDDIKARKNVIDMLNLSALEVDGFLSTFADIYLKGMLRRENGIG